MDYKPLSQSLARLLSPMLRWLLQGGDASPSDISDITSETSWEMARTLFRMLEPHLEQDPSLKTAVTEVAEHPQDEEYQTGLSLALRRHLAAHPDLAERLERVLAAAPSSVHIDARQGGVYVSGGGTLNIRGDVVGRDRYGK